MKKFLLAALFTFPLITGWAQMHNAFPPQAAEFYNRAMPKIKIEIANLITNTAALARGNTMNGDSLCREIKKVKLLKNINDRGCKAIALLILIRCSMNADISLKNIVLKMQHGDEGKDYHEETESLLNRKSNLAGQIKMLLSDVSDENIALKDLK